jgi:hypothetical protein
VDRLVRAANRRLMLLAGVGALWAGRSVMTDGARTLSGWSEGPWAVPQAFLVSATGAADFRRNFVRVEGERSVDVGRALSRNTNTGDTTVTAKYAMLLTGGRLLLVKAAADDPEGTTAYTGTITPVPESVQTSFLAKARDADPSAVAALLPFMLDATNRQGGARFGLLCMAALAAWSLWKLKQAVERRADPLRHPSLRALAVYGDPRVVADAISAEIAAGNPRRQGASARLTRNWILIEDWFGFRAMATHDVAWIYKKVTKHSVNFVPTGKSYAAVVHSQRGVTFEIAGNDAQTDEALREVYQRAPWALVGYEAAAVAAMQGARRAETIAHVAARRDEMLRT